MLRYIFSFLLLFIMAPTIQADVLLKDIDGQSTSFSSLQGKWVLINYWAGWCQSCIDEIPELNLFYQRHKEDPVAMFAVNFDALPVFAQKNLIRDLNIKYPSLVQDPAERLGIGDINGVPVTFIFNPQGKLVKTLYGRQSARSLERVLASL